MTDSIRLSKRVAELRACSRREAEQLISAGWVRVDGTVVDTPEFRVSDQRIDIDPDADPAQIEPVTLLLNKPVGMSMREGDLAALKLLTPATLWADDASGIAPLKIHFSQLAAGIPLETDASGLVVFTQDWRIARKLTEDAATLEHELIVEVSGQLAPNGLKRMNTGVAFNDRTPPAIKVSWQNETKLRIALKGCQIGQIVHLCEAAGLEVVSMKRIRLGGVSLGKVPEGQWRYLREGERF
ncbi:MAG: rRNA pseudouridine synthase [Thiobacillus sp.]|nr:rRNA pseudouridine synthase [Thiobacillus sp.]